MLKTAIYTISPFLHIFWGSKALLLGSWGRIWSLLFVASKLCLIFRVELNQCVEVYGDKNRYVNEEEDDEEFVVFLVLCYEGNDA